MEKLSKRVWASFIIVGLVGQFAWTIENMYFNVFLYNTISTDPGMIAAMVSASAVVATLTTLLMGALSDRVGKRRIFISAGYILWGVSTMAVGLVSVERASALFPAVNAVALAGGMVVALDCVMTFFGSTANDAAFNAYITDVTTDATRGRAESVLATLPLISMLVIFGAFDGMTQQGQWLKFFSIFGAMVTATGVASFFLIKDSAPRGRGGYFAELIYGFRPSVIRGLPLLYLALVSFCVFSVSVQVFFPYLIIYMQNYLKIDAYAIVLGIVLIVASVVSVLAGRVIDRVGKLRFAVPAAFVMLAGLVLMFFARSFIAVIGAGIVMMGGYMLVTAALSAVIRDYTPKDKAGHFQGIRMIFAVLLPMVTGPYIGAALIRKSGETYTELGVIKQVPTPAIFLGAAVVLALALIPVFILKKRSSRECQ